MQGIDASRARQVMEFISVQSSTVDRIAYDSDTKELEVIFHSEARP